MKSKSWTERFNLSLSLINFFVSFCLACVEKFEIKGVSGSFRQIIMISD